MKRVLAALILVFIFAFPCFAIQKTDTTDSGQWQLVDALSRVAGVAGPSSIGPVSGAQLIIALDRIPKDSLDADELEIRNQIYSSIAEPDGVYNSDSTYVGLELPIGLESYLNYGDASEELDWAIAGYGDRLSLASPFFEIEVADSVYGKIRFDIVEKENTIDWGKLFTTNLDFSNFSPRVPNEALVSLGTDFLNLTLGRDRMAYGHGYTGNMFIGDNFDFQEFVKLSFFSDVYEGTVSLTHFDQQKSSFNAGLKDFLNYESSRFSGKHQTRIAITQSGVFFDKFSATLMLGSLIQSDSAFDFRMFNPFMYFHSMQNFQSGTIFEANNFISLEIAWNFLPHWGFSAQMIIDQIQTGAETAHFSGATLEPNAWGVLANLSYSDIIGTSVMNVYLEAAYTSPALYLNEKYIDDEGNTYYPKADGISDTPKYDWNQDLIVGYWKDDGFADVSYSGYGYGPDSLVLSIGSSLIVPDTLNLSAHVSFIAHGEKGIPFHDNQDPTFEGETGNDNYNRPSFSGEVVEKAVEFALELEWNAFDGINVYSGIGYRHVWNYHNNPGISSSNFQLAIGIGIDPIAFSLSFLV